MKILFLIFLLNISYCFCDLDSKIDQADQKVGKLYRYDRCVMEAFDNFILTLKTIDQKQKNFPSQKLLEALIFAAENHKKDKDQSKSPLIINLINLLNTLYHQGNVRSANVLIASLLKQAPEDEIEALFGSRVYSTVKELKNEKDICLMSMDAQLITLSEVVDKGKIEEDIDREKLLSSFSGVNESLEKKLCSIIDN